jgi:hypothetical protein
MFARDWTISDNTFVGIQGRTRQARGAIFVWHESEGCVIERNVIVDCDSGICLGNSHRPADIAIHCTGFMVRNNFVTRAPENGILADYTRDCQILHNTVHDPGNRLGRLIRLVHDNAGLRVANNLLSGPPLRNESTSRIELRNNLQEARTAYFVDPETGNLRLTAGATDAIDRAVPLPEVTEDIDRRPRGARPDIGAHEFSSPPSPVPSSLNEPSVPARSDCLQLLQELQRRPLILRQAGARIAQRPQLPSHLRPHLEEAIPTLRRALAPSAHHFGHDCLDLVSMLHRYSSSPGAVPGVVDAPADLATRAEGRSIWTLHSEPRPRSETEHSLVVTLVPA